MVFFVTHLSCLAFPDGVIISEFKILLNCSQPGDVIPRAGVIESSTQFGPSSTEGHEALSKLQALLGIQFLYWVHCKAFFHVS